MKLRTIFKYGVVAAIVALTAWGASAISVDQTRNTVARQNSTYQTSYYRVTVNFNDANIGTAQKFGRLLQNTFISNVACHVTTAFNAGTNNNFFLGTSTSPNEIIASNTSTKKISETATGYQQITQAGSLGVSVTSDADHDLFVRYIQSGTAATAGQVMCVIEFIPNNDM